MQIEIDAGLAKRAFTEAYQKYPRYEALGPRLVLRPLYQGFALMLEYDEQPPPGDKDAWEFQNAVVKSYKRLAGG